MCEFCQNTENCQTCPFSLVTLCDNCIMRSHEEAQRIIDEEFDRLAAEKEPEELLTPCHGDDLPW